ncbi:MAG: PilN domain-containing protein [Pseudomonadota bacterium]
MLSRSVIGVTVTKKWVSVVWLRGTASNFSLVASSIEAFDKEKTLKDRCERSEKFLKDFFQSQNIASAEIRLGLSREFVILRSIVLPLAVKENLRSTLNYEIGKYIPFSAEDVYFNYDIVSADKKSKTITVALAVVKLDDIEPLIKSFGSLMGGATSLEMDAAGLAVALGHYSGHGDTPFAFARVGTDSIDLGFSNGKTLAASHVIPMEADHPKDFHVTLAQAVSTLFPPSMSEVPIPLIVTGGAVTQEFVHELEALVPNAVTAVDTQKQQIPSSDLLEALGIAINGIRNVPVRLNLLPEDKRRKVGKTGYYLMMILGALAILTGVFWIGGAAVHNYVLDKRLDAELARIKGSVNEINLMLRETENREKKIQRFNTLREKSVIISDVLLELTKIIPENSWVEEFGYAKGQFRIEGYADSASDLLTRLEKSQKFKEVVFLSAITRRNDKERYRIGFRTD